MSPTPPVERFQRHAELFRALSEETRLAMLVLLFEEEELCVCDFVAVLEITQSKASRHLRYMRNAGLLEDRREGVWVHYGLARKPDRNTAEVLSAMAALVEKLPAAALRRKLRRRTQSKSGCTATATNGRRRRAANDE